MIWRTAEQKFWAWFLEHENDYLDFDQRGAAERERLFDALQDRLVRINKHLVFEFGPEIEGRREFTISADGIRESFPSVTKLVAAAPQMERWRVQAFRQRMESLCGVQMGDIHIDPDQIQCSLMHNGDLIGLYLFLPGYQEDRPVFKQVGYLMLDQALGEYDVETKLGLIEMCEPQEKPEFERIPLTELAHYFDRLYGQLHPDPKPS